MVFTIQNPVAQSIPSASTASSAASLHLMGSVKEHGIEPFSFGNVAVAELQRSPSQKQVSLSRTLNAVVWLQSPTLSSVSPQLNVGIFPYNVSENS